MTKQEMKQVIYRSFMRAVEPDMRDELMSASIASAEQRDTWDLACREVMYEMDRRSRGKSARRKTQKVTA